MKPDDDAQHVLSTVRARAKMYEFRVSPEDFPELPRDPSVLFSLAVGILGDSAAAIARSLVEPEFPGRPETWSEEDGSISEQVRFSATFFDAYLDSRLNGEITTEFSLLCATAYYLSDAVGSAVVVVRRSEPPPLELGGGLARLGYKILKAEYDPIEGEFAHTEVANALLGALNAHYGLEGEDDGIVSLCREMRDRMYASGTPRELLYADIVTALCARKLRNSSRTLIPPSSGLPLEAWAPALKKPNFPIELWPAQQRICEQGLLTGRSAVIQMPTSAGKTRATELIIRSAFLSMRTSLAVIVAPFRSLCHDIRGDMVKAFSGENVLLDEVSDSYLFDVELEQVFQQDSVLVITPEKLLYMLRRAPELADRIGLVIYDEGHQFEGFARGPTYELLLSSLRMMLKDDAQVVLISAVIGNAPEIAEWLIGDRDAVIGGEGLLATSKSIAFASWQSQRGQLQYVQPLDPDESEFFVPRLIDELPLEKFKKSERDRVFPERGRPNENSESAEVGLYLGLHLVPNGSVALFCGQKGSVTKICRRVAEIFDRKVGLTPPLAFSDATQVERIANLVARHLGKEADAARGATLGVLPHHANIPRGIRLSVEHAMKEGHARFVACTSTLAQGVNFPIKYLVITATQQGREKIKVRDFHNLMGRAGRAGMHTESSVIFSATAIYDERKTPYRNWRWMAAKKLLDPAEAEPSKSSILAIFDDYQQVRPPPVVLAADPNWLDLTFADEDTIAEVVASVLEAAPVVSGSEFRDYIRGRARAVQSIAAYLASHVDFDAADAGAKVEELAANTLAYHLAEPETREKLLNVFRAIAEAMIANSDADYRALIRKSPLPPADIRKLSAWLAANREALVAAAKTGDLVNVVVTQALPHVSAKSLATLSDQSVIPSILQAWMSGETFEAIKERLRASGVKISGDWPTVEHAVAICEDGFSYHLAMILASIADLVDPLDDDLSDWIAAVQREVKNGLAGAAENAFYEAGFADRVVAAELANTFPDVADRADVHSKCRSDHATVHSVLSQFPAYFTVVAAELAG